MGLKLLAIFALLDLAVVAVSTAVPGRGAKPSVSDEVMANRKAKRQAKRRWQRKQLQEDEKKLKDEPAPTWETSSYMLQYGHRSSLRNAATADDAHSGIIGQATCMPPVGVTLC